MNKPNNSKFTQGSPNPQGQKNYSVDESVKKSFKEFDLKSLYNSQAEKVAKVIHQESSGKFNKNSQIRKFYDELYNLKMKVELSKDVEAEFSKVLPIVYLLGSKSAYARGRDKIGDNFFNFLKSNVMKIESFEDLKTFLLYFEAVLGYYKFLNPKE